jgi:hypothetical protein
MRLWVCLRNHYNTQHTTSRFDLTTPYNIGPIGQNSIVNIVKTRILRQYTDPSYSPYLPILSDAKIRICIGKETHFDVSLNCLNKIWSAVLRCIVTINISYWIYLEQRSLYNR